MSINCNHSDNTLIIIIEEINQSINLYLLEWSK